MKKSVSLLGLPQTVFVYLHRNANTGFTTSSLLKHVIGTLIIFTNSKNDNIVERTMVAKACIFF